MTLPEIDQIERLPHAELVRFVKTLVIEVQRLRTENQELRAELGKYRQPPATSQNSSQPPSRDQKRNFSGKKRKKHGRPYGHERAIRPLVDNPDEVIEAKVERCERCEADLEGIEPERILRHQITEAPLSKAVVIETREHEVRCPNCRRINRGKLPKAYNRKSGFGPRISALVVYLKQEQHMSYERICRAMEEIFGVKLSEGGVDGIMREGGEAAEVVAEEIRKQVVGSEIIGSDETSARVEGSNWWEWVFVSSAGVYHTIRETRGAKVIEETMGENRAVCWISDCFSSQMTAPTDNYQLCLAHQLRDLQRVIETGKDVKWAVEMKELFQEAIHLWNREASLTINGLVRRTTEMGNRLDRLLEQELRGKKAIGLQQRYINHRDGLFTFLHYPGVEPTNNQCERALRPSVIHRKVTNGFRSKRGAKTYAALRTLASTARQQGKRFFDELTKLFGPPIFQPFLP